MAMKYLLPPLKKSLLLPLKLPGLFGELLPKRRGVRGLLCLSFYVDTCAKRLLWRAPASPRGKEGRGNTFATVVVATNDGDDD